MKFETPCIWMNGKFVKWKDATIHVMTHALHYGSGVFEGIRCYDTPHGPVLFRLKEHIDRFFWGMKALSMAENFSKKEIMEAILKLIKKNHLKDCYVRPFAFYGYGNVGVNPKNRETCEVLVAVPFKDYLPPDKAIDVVISPLKRVNRDALIPGAKISGLYYNAVLSGQWARRHGADEALMLDHRGMIGEGASSNFFGVKKMKNKPVLVTPRSPDILEGITRDTVIRLARHLKIPVKIQTISRKDLGRLEEAFFTGTAVEIHPIGQINGKQIGTGKHGPVTETLRNLFRQVTHGEILNFRSWLTSVR